MNGEALYPEMLSPTDVPGILKLRIHGSVQLRPLICRGPVSRGMECTLLRGAIEKGGKLPAGAVTEALQMKKEVQKDPTNRRKPHERSTKKTG